VSTNGNIDSMENMVLDPTKRLYRVTRAADILDVSKAHLYKLIQEGSIRVVRVGQSIRIPSDVISEMVERGSTPRG
jgi:excisionase family DNA binding protein